MLVGFTLENWMSFRAKTVFSMVSSRERQHGDRISRLGKYQMGVLPIAAIYGGNASGKTNFFRAMSFAKALVTRGTQPDSPIPVEPFLLDANGHGEPSRFSFELLVGETIYEFSFAVTAREVVEEKLVAIASRRERVLYHRRDGKPHFDDSLTGKQFLQFAFQGTRENQLFLTNSVSQRVDDFRPIYDWFRSTLELVAPDSRFEPFEQFLDEKHPLYSTMNAMLPQLDTGIARLSGDEILLKNIPLPEAIKAMLQAEVKEGMAVRLATDPPACERIVVTRKGGELVAKKLVAYHPKTDGTEAKFEIHRESNGSQRVIDLLPAFLALSAQDARKVYVIDEVDRSLHTLLTRKLIEVYLANCSPEARTQLLLTTHDVQLMDQQLLRRDEMWVAERDVAGVSTLLSFNEYRDVRHDRDLRRSYLQGRLGGIPRILLGNATPNSMPRQEKREG